MSPEFKYLMSFCGNSSQGTKPEAPPDQLDWNKLYRLSNEQTVSTLLAYALKTNPSISCPESIRTSAIASMRTAAINNYMRRERILALLRIFEDTGIHAVLLKGYAVAGEYCSPECRVSADTDVWVAPVDEERACELLKRQGFSVDPRWKNGHHAVCHHPTMGCLELHVILYDEIVEEVWFNKMDGSEFIQEPHEWVKTDVGSYYSLGKTDYIIFLTLHMIKHFIISGMSLRMMLDVALFYKNHIGEFDIERFWNTMRSLKYECCVNTILWAMVMYAGFSHFVGMSDTPPENIDEILDDLELGGTMGIKDKQNREEGWHAFNREKLMQSKSGIGYKLYMIKWQSSGYLKALFPDKRTLAKRYPYVNDKTWLIPYAWVHRLIFRGIVRLRRGEIKSNIVSDESKLAVSGKERLEMFRRLGMI
jgi:hypothetical protein